MNQKSFSDFSRLSTTHPLFTHDMEQDIRRLQNAIKDALCDFEFHRIELQELSSELGHFISNDCQDIGESIEYLHNLTTELDYYERYASSAKHHERFPKSWQWQLKKTKFALYLQQIFHRFDNHISIETIISSQALEDMFKLFTLIYDQQLAVPEANFNLSDKDNLVCYDAPTHQKFIKLTKQHDAILSYATTISMHKHSLTSHPAYILQARINWINMQGVDMVSMLKAYLKRHIKKQERRVKKRRKAHLQRILNNGE